jgi:uncharacterized protein YycO
MKLDDLQYGDILLLKTAWIESRPVENLGDLYGRVIRFVQSFSQKPTYCHVAIYAGEGDVVEALMENGVVKKNLTFDERWDVARLQLPQDQIDKFMEVVKKDIGKGYDLLGVALIGLELLTPTDIPDFDIDGFFCSELVASALERSGNKGFNKQPCDVSPSDFPASNMRIIND